MLTVLTCLILLPIVKCMYNHCITVSQNSKQLFVVLTFFYRVEKKETAVILSDSDDNFKPSKKPPQPIRKRIINNSLTYTNVKWNILNIFFLSLQRLRKNFLTH